MDKTARLMSGMGKPSEVCQVLCDSGLLGDDGQADLIEVSRRFNELKQYPEGMRAIQAMACSILNQTISDHGTAFYLSGDNNISYTYHGSETARAIHHEMING